jgi:hypothetical protein
MTRYQQENENSLDFEITFQVLYPSGCDYYRVKSQYVKEKWVIVIWCENKPSHQHWEGSFNEESKVCPSDVQIPMEDIMSYLSTALTKVHRYFYQYR